jgi:hypothetical protein
MVNDHFRMWMGALSIVAILLVVATGFCLFDTDGDDHGAAGLDLCLGMIAAAFGALLLVDLHDAGRSPVLRRWTPTPVTIPVLDPPPWSSLSV